MSGERVLAGQITINFRASVPLETVHTAEAWVAQKDGRKVFTVGQLKDPSGGLLTEGEGLFVELKQERLDALKRAGFYRPGGDFFGALVSRAERDQ